MKNRLTLIWALACILYCATASRAANNLCVFKQTTAPYVELTGDSNITALTFDSGYFHIPAVTGELLPLLGNPWTFDTTNRTLFAFPNGRVYVGIDTGFAIFDCLYTDSISLIDNSSKVSYTFQGAAGKKILKIQWKNLRIDSGPANNYFNVQMWLYQETGVIEFRYGPRSANNASGYNDPLTGIYAGIWYSNMTFSKMYEKMQVTGLPPNISIDSVLNLNVPNLLGVPEEGTVYRFVPKAVLTSVKGVKKAMSVELYPNPASNEVVVDFKATVDAVTASLFDMNGRKIRTVVAAAGSSGLIMPVRDLPLGAYQLLVDSRDEEFVGKVMVR